MPVIMLELFTVRGFRAGQWHSFRLIKVFDLSTFHCSTFFSIHFSRTLSLNGFFFLNIDTFVLRDGFKTRLLRIYFEKLLDDVVLSPKDHLRKQSKVSVKNFLPYVFIRLWRRWQTAADNGETTTELRQNRYTDKRGVISSRKFDDLIKR